MAEQEVLPCSDCVDPEDLRAAFDTVFSIRREVNRLNDSAHATASQAAGDIKGEAADVAAAEQAREGMIDNVVRFSQVTDEINTAIDEVVAFASTADCDQLGGTDRKRCARADCLALILPRITEAQVTLAMRDVDNL